MIKQSLQVPLISNSLHGPRTRDQGFQNTKALMKTVICFLNKLYFSVKKPILGNLVQKCCCSVTQSCPTLWPHGLQHTRLLCFSVLPGVCSNSHPLSQWCHPTISSSLSPFSSCPQSFPASGALNESTLCIRWSKYWSFSFSISPSNEYSVLISFKIDWFDLLVVQGTLKSFLQHCNWKASILQCSAFFMVIEFCLKAPIKNHLTGKLYLSPWEEVLSGNQLPRRKSSTVQ